MGRELQILVTAGISKSNEGKLLRISPGAAITFAKQADVALEQVRRSEIMVGWPSAAHLKEAKNLRWLHLPSAGAERFVDVRMYAHPGVILTNSSGVFGMPIAEHVFAMILAFNRDLRTHILNNQESRWLRNATARDFWGKTTGIIGLGDIGSEVAKRAHAWGSRVLGVKRQPGQCPPYLAQLYSPEGLDEVLAQADYLVLALPATEQSKGIMSEERLRMMKPSAFLVNIGRGALVDQDALIKALSEHWIAGAGLDVTTPEPLPPESPLWKMPNVLITSHSSGSSPTNGERIFKIFADNLERYLQSRPLLNVVDLRAGY